MYYYKRTEPNLFTVGTLDGGEWITDSDHESRELAAMRVSYLNGGGDPALRGRLRQLERDVPALINCVRYLANEIGEINPGVADAMKQRVELMLEAAKQDYDDQKDTIDAG